MQEFDWTQTLHFLKLIGISYVLALPVGWDRDKAARGAGIRTFPLVACASCAYCLIAVSLNQTLDVDVSRIVQGIVTGIGFIGGGAIMKSDNRVEGTSTAASIWGTGALGTAVAFQRYEIAIVIALITFLTFVGFKQVKKEESKEYGDDAKEK